MATADGEPDLSVVRREDHRDADAQAAPVRLVRLRPALIPKAPRQRKRLGNPLVELFEEVGNRRATWIDAVFWFVLGVVGQACGHALWEALK